MTGLAVCLASLAIIAAAWHLSPDRLPFGAKTQISLPGCAFRQRTGYPCPTCGMTTAWAQAVRGNLILAFRANIAAALLALACPIIGLAGLGTALAGAGFYHRFVRPVISILEPLHWAYALAGLVLLAWGCNVLRAFVE